MANTLRIESGQSDPALQDAFTDCGVSALSFKRPLIDRPDTALDKSARDSHSRNAATDATRNTWRPRRRRWSCAPSRIESKQAWLGIGGIGGNRRSSLSYSKRSPATSLRRARLTQRRREATPRRARRRADRRRSREQPFEHVASRLLAFPGPRPGCGAHREADRRTQRR